jgi:hypothetical protein
MHSRSSTTYLNHDHRESENVRFLAMYPLVQNLWRSPPRTVTMLTRGTPYRIWVLSDCGEAKIRETRMARVVHKDIHLAECQCGGETIFRTTTYSLEVPVNDIARVEVAEALSDIR